MPGDTCPYDPRDEPLGTANDAERFDESCDKHGGCLRRFAAHSEIARTLLGKQVMAGANPAVSSIFADMAERIRTTLRG